MCVRVRKTKTNRKAFNLTSWITPVNLKKIDLHGKKVQCAER